MSSWIEWCLCERESLERKTEDRGIACERERERGSVIRFGDI